MMLKTKPTEQKIKPTENGYSSLTDEILGIKPKPRKLKLTEVVNNVVTAQRYSN